MSLTSPAVSICGTSCEITLHTHTLLVFRTDTANFFNCGDVSSFNFEHFKLITQSQIQIHFEFPSCPGCPVLQLKVEVGTGSTRSTVQRPHHPIELQPGSFIRHPILASSFRNCLANQPALRKHGSIPCINPVKRFHILSYFIEVSMNKRLLKTYEEVLATL
jgi:hypothetical protein